MSRLYGRVEDVYNFYKYLLENYDYKYVKDNKEISNEELQDTPKLVIDYLDKTNISYLNSCNINYYWNRKSKDIVYGDDEDDSKSIFFPTKIMKEEYKAELMYFIGDILRRKSPDYMNDEYDICCQYTDTIPLLIEYLYFKETNNSERFITKNFDDLKINAPIFNKIHDRAFKYPVIYTEDVLLRNTLLNLVPLSSMDAVLQIVDKYGQDKDKLRKILFNLIENVNHNREEVINDININTYGLKRLRKEIDLRKKGD